MAGPSTGVNYFREMSMLKEEEKTLLLILDKFQDNLNRLKIEELALTSLMKMQNSKERDGQVSGHQSNPMSPSVDSISDTSSVVPGVTAFEKVGSINEIAVDLQVDNVQALGKQVDAGLDYSDYDEEDDDEEEGEDTDQMDGYTRTLTSFMDEFS